MINNDEEEVKEIIKVILFCVYHLFSRKTTTTNLTYFKKKLYRNNTHFLLIEYKYEQKINTRSHLVYNT